MNYEEARVYLDQMSKYGSVLGLESMKALLNRLNNPQDRLRFIHISGTNGKGSVLAYLSFILQTAGYRTGQYSSPSLFSYRERIQVNHQEIEKDSLARHITEISHVIDEMRRAQEPLPTVFEVETALAFLYFEEKKCDLVVLETGLGGTLDATNAVKTTLLEIITPIGLDHTAELGSTLEEIAQQKAGIIKEGTRVVTASQDKKVQKILKQVCKERKCSLQEVDLSYLRNIHYGWEEQHFSYKQWENLKISLAGKFQIQNAALVLEAVEALREESFSISDNQVFQALSDTRWKGRFTILSKDPLIILDGAHNPHAAQALKSSLEFYFKDKKIHYIFGVFKDKDYKKIIEITAPLAEHIITIQTPENPRALSAELLKQSVEKVHPSVEAADSMESAVRKSLNRMEKKDVLVIFGSLSFLNLAEQVIRESGEIHG